MRVVRNESGYIDNVLRSEYHGIDLGLLFRPGCPLSGVKELHLRRRIWERDEGDDDDDSARELEGRRDVLRAAQQLAGMSHLQVLVEEESCVGLTRMRKVPADHMLRLDDGVCSWFAVR